MTTTRMVDADGLGAKTRQLDVRSSASIEVEEIRASWAAQVNDALELAQVGERVDHRSYARQGAEIEPTGKMGRAAAASERRGEDRKSDVQGTSLSYRVDLDGHQINYKKHQRYNDH